MAAARRADDSLPEDVLDDEVVELLDVPAAIVCATCGKPDCAGCFDDVGNKTESGVVVFVPWERPAIGLFSRIWGTTRASTEGAESFFSSMPKGPVGPALSFAIAAEAVAVGSSILMGAGALSLIVALILPSVARAVLHDPRWQMVLMRMTFTAWLAFTVMLVGAHALHGATLHVAAVRRGGKGELSRALRFGLYAAGWDVATSPFGLMVSLFTGGLRGVAGARVHAFHTPGRATTAMLRGLYGVTGVPAIRARRWSMTITMTGSVLAIIAALFAVFLAA